MQSLQVLPEAEEQAPELEMPRREMEEMNKTAFTYMMLRQAAEAAGISVWDTEEDGPGVTIWRKLNKKYYPSNYLITIGYFKSKLQRVFVLAHELGHCTMLRVTDCGELYLKNRKTPCGELRANLTAVKILSEFDSKYVAKFVRFYNWSNRHSNRRKRLRIKR